MLLTVEYNEAGFVEFFMDEEGREALVTYLNRLDVKNREIDHDHLMTPAWAGDELSEELQNADNVLINKLNLILVR